MPGAGCNRIATSTTLSRRSNRLSELGRQAMADIRRTVGLLDGAPMKIDPEPSVDEIASLVDDFVVPA